MEPPRVGEYSTQPDALVQLLAAGVSSASELPAGVDGILADSVGIICEPPSRLQRFADLNTTPALVAAEALELSCTYFKSSLIGHLQSLGDSGVSILEFLDELVTTWLHLQQRRRCARSSLRACDEGTNSTNTNTNTGHSRCDGANNGSSQWPAVNRESFDVAVVAFSLFRDKPGLFGPDWTAGSQFHIKAVESMTDAFRSAFEAEIHGPWQHQQNHSDEGDWLLGDEELVPARMPETMFETLLSECSDTLSLRQLRNESLAHPFDHPDPEVRQQVFELFKEEVAEGGRVVGKMPLLASAAIGHVRSMLDRVKDKELESERVEPGSMRMRDIYWL